MSFQRLPHQRHAVAPPRRPSASRPRALAALLAIMAAGASILSAVPIAELLPERLRSVVAVEFTIQTEIDRRLVSVAGTVVDDAGTILIPGTPILPGLSVSQLRDFKVYRPDASDSFPAEYLGPDALTGFHYVRAADALRPELRSVTSFPVAPAPVLGAELWGIGLRGKEEDFTPYVLAARVAMLARLPNRTALAAHDVASPGLPVFDAEGRLAGLAMNPFGQNFLLFSRTQAGAPIMLVNAEESSVVLLAEDLMRDLGRVPETTAGRPVAWTGIYGMQPVDPEVARLLDLEKRPGLVLSDILDDSPAARAGLRDRDIVLAVDGEPLPRLKPDRGLAGWFSQQILRRRPGEVLALEVLRGRERVRLDVTLGDEPRMVREAERRWFERLGFTVREFLVADRMLHRAGPGEAGGVTVHFLKPNSPVAAAGLRPDDWIREIDGVPVDDFAAAVARLAVLEEDLPRAEFVLLTRRGGETQVLRVKLN